MKQVLPLSVKQIVMMTPVEFDEFPDLRFVGQSETKFFRLDPLSVRMLLIID